MSDDKPQGEPDYIAWIFASVFVLLFIIALALTSGCSTTRFTTTGPLMHGSRE